MTGESRVILVRHGQTEWNKSGRYQGCSNTALSEEGRKQAAAVAKRFSRVPLAAVYASDLDRARETAGIIAAAHGLPVTLTEGLREINFGHWEGLTFAQIEEQYPELAAQWLVDPTLVTIPGGEDFELVKERAWKVLGQLVRQHEGQEVLLVSHGATIRTLICAVLDLPLKHLFQIRQDNVGVSIVEYAQERFFLACLNDTCHVTEC